MPINDTFRGRLLVLPLLALLVLALPACGGDENSDLPKAVVRDDGADKSGDATPPADPMKDYKEAKEPAMPPGHPGTAPAGPPVPPETVIVTVNGQEITQGEIDKEIARMVFGGRPVPPAQMAMVRSRFGPQAEKMMIERKLLEDAIEKETLEVSAEELAARWKEIETRLPEGVTRAQVLERNGLTQEAADVEITRAIKMEKLLNKHAPTEPISDEKAKEHYDSNLARFKTPAKVRARHILLKVDKGATDEEKASVKKKMEEIKAELAKEGGKDFAALALEHSGCPSKAKGGDLGFFGKGQMVPEFDKLAFTLEKDVVSEPFLTDFGWHIMEVQEKTEARTKPFEEVKEQVKKQLGQGDLQKAQTAYLDTLRASAKIERPAKK